MVRRYVPPQGHLPPKNARHAVPSSLSARRIQPACAVAKTTVGPRDDADAKETAVKPAPSLTQAAQRPSPAAAAVGRKEPGGSDKLPVEALRGAGLCRIPNVLLFAWAFKQLDTDRPLVFAEAYRANETTLKTFMDRAKRIDVLAGLN